MAYTAPTFVNDAAPALDATNMNALAQCAEGNQNLAFYNVVVNTSAFVSDATYEQWPYRAPVPLSGVVTSMVPTVTFAPDDAASGVLAPVAATYSGGVYLYATNVPANNLTIPTITCVQGVE